MPSLKIENTENGLAVYLDGHEVNGIQNLTLNAHTDSVLHVSLRIIVDDIKVDSIAIAAEDVSIEAALTVDDIPSLISPTELMKENTL